MLDDAEVAPLHLLLVDDCDSDAELLGEACALAPLPCTLTHARSVEEGLALAQAGGCDLILTDLHLPGQDGFELLRQLKAQAQTCAIPVLVLTGSASETEIERAYHLHASSVLRKAASFTEMQALVAALGEYWGRVVRLPSRASLRTA